MCAMSDVYNKYEYNLKILFLSILNYHIIFHWLFLDC